MNRQNTVLIKQFPEHTRKTTQEIINMLFTWNGKEKSKLAGQPAENTGPAQQSSTNGQMHNCDAVHPESTESQALRPPKTEERPFPSSVGTAIQDIRTWTDTWRSCRWLAPRRVPGMSESSLHVPLLRNSTNRAQRARQANTRTPHTCSGHTA